MSDPLSIFTFKPVPVPLANGNTAYVRRLPAIDKINWMAEITARGDQPVTAEVNLDDQCRFLQKTLCDEEGNLLFADSPPIKQGIDDATISALFDAATAENGLKREPAESGEDAAGKPESESSRIDS